MRSKFARRWTRIGLLFGAGLLLLAIFLPSILSARWIYQPVLDLVNRGGFEVSIDEVELSWVSPLRLRGVSVRPDNKPEVVQIGELRTDRGLLGYIFGGRRLGRLEIRDIQVAVELLENSSNLNALIDALQESAGEIPKDEKKKPPEIDIDLEIANLSAVVQQQDSTNPLVVVPPFSVSVAYRAASGDSTVQIEPANILKRVRLTPELLRLGLDHAIPILAKSAWIDGEVSLDTEVIRIPLDHPLDSTGKARLTLHQVRSGPNDPNLLRLLALIAQFQDAQVSEELTFIDGSIIEIELRDQFVQHSGLRVGLPTVDPRLQLTSSGTVGLKDKTLNQVLDISVPIEQLARRESVRELGVPVVSLPIVGTLDEPKVDWTALRKNSADIIGLIRTQVESESPNTAAVLGALEGLADGQQDQAITAAVDVLKAIRDRRNAKRANGTTTQNDDRQVDEAGNPSNPQDTPRDGIRGRLRDLLRRDKKE